MWGGVGPAVRVGYGFDDWYSDSGLALALARNQSYVELLQLYPLRFGAICTTTCNRGAYGRKPTLPCRGGLCVRKAFLPNAREILDVWAQQRSAVIYAP